MTLMDWITLGIIKSDAQAEQMAADIVDLWHADKIPGQLREVLGLSHREYQAWTTGGVSLLTIAAWKNSGPPSLDPKKPWFKLRGRPGHEEVGYLGEVSSTKSLIRWKSLPGKVQVKRFDKLPAAKKIARSVKR
jgi:hypothetical protein